MQGALCVYGVGLGLASIALASCGGGDSGGHAGSSGGGGASSASTSSGMGMTSSGSSSSGGEGGGQAGGAGAGGGVAVSCANLPLCDDFEGAGADPDPALWQKVSPNCGPNASTLTIDDTVAHSGKKSVKVVGGGSYCDHIFLSNADVIKSIGGPVFGRFFVRLSDALGAGHTTFAAMHDINDAGGKDLRMGGQSQILMWNRESDDATLPSLSPVGIAKSTSLPPMTWACVEFMVDGASRNLKTWVDGKEIEGLIVDAAPTPDVDQNWLNNANWKPSLQDFRLGWESYAGQTMTLWFDDVALAPARIGCN